MNTTHEKIGNFFLEAAGVILSITWSIVLILLLYAIGTALPHAYLESGLGQYTIFLINYFFSVPLVIFLVFYGIFIVPKNALGRTIYTKYRRLTKEIQDIKKEIRES